MLAYFGVAWGPRGTLGAREAAAMILQDDRFATIVEAVAQGRAIYANIRKFVVYLMSCNISEILVVGLATLAGAPLPLLPLQILFLNLVTDVFPALALGVGEGAPGLMREGPRPAGEALLTRRHWVEILAYGVMLSSVVLGAMAIAVFGLGFAAAEAVTVSFLTLALGQLWHVFNMRDDRRRPLRNEITRNPAIWGAIVICLGLTLGAVYLPGISSLLALSHPGAAGWALILVMSVLPLVIGPLLVRRQPRHCGNPQAQSATAD
jgi:Ca2+-transporting ATPase